MSQAREPEAPPTSSTDPDAVDPDGTPVAGAGDEGPEGAAPTSRSRRRPARSRRFRALRETAIIVVIALVVSFLVKTFLLQAFWIPSASMQDTLQIGDRVFVTKVQAGPFAIERGDVVVFEDPGGWLPPVVEEDRGPFLNAVDAGLQFVGLAANSEGNHLIKRVIGMGGDNVVCCSSAGNLTVNGEPIEETYLFPGDSASTQAFDITVPEDSVWVMGDHRSDSSDSRFHDPAGDGSDGSVPADLIVGQATVLVWPLDRWDWMIGDGTEVFDDVPDPS